MAATRRLNELISTTIPKLELPEGPVVVALSGGADSAALALLAIEAGQEVTVVHVDHGLPSSPMMSQAAEAVAGTLRISLVTKRVQIPPGPSPEDRAREARYRAFEEIGGPVLTAHTRDDLVETVLMNLVRGSGAAGLSGIPRFRPPHVYRPMLDVTRAETRELATLAGLPFADDPMNQDMSLTRNRVRHRILPLMRELNPQVDSALARAAQALERDAEFLEGLALPHARDPLPASVLTTLPRPLADRLVMRALERHGIAPTADRIERLWSVATGASRRQDLAEGLVARRAGALVVIEPDDS